MPEGGFLKEAFANMGVLLASTQRVVLATAIANIYAREPSTMANGAKTLAEAFPGRFVLGLGVSHREEVEDRRGRAYDRPVAAMRAYLDAMDAAPYVGTEPHEPAPRLLAALGPRMLGLAAERTHGSHPYFVPVAHTALARDLSGPQPFIGVAVCAALTPDAVEARRLAREHASKYLRWENYRANLRRLGFADDDLEGGGSDRLLDAVVAQGDEEAIRTRVQEHLDAGASHVCIQPLPAFGDAFPLDALRRLAPALLDL